MVEVERDRSGRAGQEVLKRPRPGCARVRGPRRLPQVRDDRQRREARVLRAHRAGDGEQRLLRGDGRSDRQRPLARVAARQRRVAKKEKEKLVKMPKDVST